MRPGVRARESCLWGTNLTDEQYVNGGFDTRTVWGFNFSVIGQPRQYGVGFNITF